MNLWIPKPYISILTWLAAASIFGCSTYPTDPAGQTAYYLELASKALANNDGRAVRRNIDHAVWSSDQTEQLRKFFVDKRGALQAYLASTQELIVSAYNPNSIIEARQVLEKLYSSGLLDQKVYADLQTQIENRCRLGNEDGSLAFRLAHDLRGLGLRESNHQMGLIVERSLKWAAESTVTSKRQIGKIMTYAIDADTPAEHKARIESALDSLYITADELPYVQKAFPAFAQRRQHILERLGSSGAMPVLVRRPVWNDLAQSDKDAIQKHVRIEVLPESSYGTIIEVQSADRSTAATHAGAVAGSSIAQLAYIGRSIKHDHYSPWMQIGLGALGAMAGSALDSPAQKRYEFRYTVKLGDGELAHIERVSNTPFHHSVGTCVRAPHLKVLAQSVCEQTANQIKEKLLIKAKE